MTRWSLLLDVFVPPEGTDFGVDPLAPTGMDAMFTAVPVIIGIGFVVVIVLAIRRGARYVQHGIDPTVADVDLQAKLLKSDLLAPERAPASAPEHTVTERLAELDQLFAAGTISADEHAAARARVLDDV
ncbi:SHOCT domain-containing protein [Actinotalea sp. M2MS4P-6]|uniref:SHOCT domain-containing protein n=1 Tax=Actinotalea sp. M2MS4P-6 TaxID=2983762 RepID=UPI0021E3E855|nr:SHOCT domain-containing protein [Actinotalea sp. M2MS4P-6]MCV2395462.1 SHOCT domain-containing protein [Actinotalea sp. M2MS4P-6]